MGDTDGGDEQRGDHYAQGGSLDAVLGTGFLPIEDIQRPAHTGAQGVGGADRVEAGAGLAYGDQQQQPGDCQGDPQEIQRSARGPQRHRECAQRDVYWQGRDANSI
ncbi:hypothetical protein WR25_18951 [Diploscapter pachys]|uniref:Uncharacterized protein n=1 Tax=Diploscapter pachys TaxID=2018661 RepID=A0A2A2KFM0_9BILA|nr:hypothetical protein WR25_18951 [Diploscapter pachys]